MVGKTHAQGLRLTTDSLISQLSIVALLTLLVNHFLS